MFQLAPDLTVSRLCFGPLLSLNACSSSSSFGMSPYELLHSLFIRNDDVWGAEHFATVFSPSWRRRWCWHQLFWLRRDVSNRLSLSSHLLNWNEKGEKSIFFIRVLKFLDSDIFWEVGIPCHSAKRLRAGARSSSGAGWGHAMYLAIALFLPPRLSSCLSWLSSQFFFHIVY